MLSFCWCIPRFQSSIYVHFSSSIKHTASYKNSVLNTGKIMGSKNYLPFNVFACCIDRITFSGEDRKQSSGIWSIFL